MYNVTTWCSLCSHLKKKTRQRKSVIICIYFLWWLFMLSLLKKILKKYAKIDIQANEKTYFPCTFWGGARDCTRSLHYTLLIKICQNISLYPSQSHENNIHRKRTILSLQLNSFCSTFWVPSIKFAIFIIFDENLVEF